MLLVVDLPPGKFLYRKYKLNTSAICGVYRGRVLYPLTGSPLHFGRDVCSFLRFSVMFVFPTMPFGSHRRTSTPASRSTSTARQRRPAPFPRFFSFITVNTTVSSRLFTNTFAVVLPRTRSCLFVSSSDRACSSFTLASPLLFLRTFIAAVRVTSAEIVGTD